MERGLKLPAILSAPGIPGQVVAQLLKASEKVRFRAGEAIIRKGESPDYLWLLIRGKVIIKRAAGRGPELTLDILTPREALIGISALADGLYAASAYAGSDCILLRIPSQAVREAMKSSPELTERLFSLLVERIRHMEASIALFHHSAGHRLIQTLYGLCQKFGNEIPVTHRELAGIAGTTVETSIRTLSPLRQQGIVRLARGRITILDKARLRRIALSESFLRVARR